MSKSVWVCYADQDGEFRPTVCKIFSTEERTKEWVKMSEVIAPANTIFDPESYSFIFYYNECAVDEFKVPEPIIQQIAEDEKRVT